MNIKDSSAVTLAKLVLRSVELRENSYNHDEANKACKLDNTSFGRDYSIFYALTEEQAIEQACKELNSDPALVDVVHLLLFTGRYKERYNRLG